MAVLHPYVDRIIVGSQWHVNDVRESAGIAGDKLGVIYLGTQLEHFDGLAPVRHPHRLIYTSRANRGLAALLEIFPRIRAVVPDAELHIFGYEYESPACAPQFEGLTEPGVRFRGGVDKNALAHELRSAAVMAYPCTFRETFCISIAEAQAAGLPVVATDFAAVTERIQDRVDGFLIPGSVESPEFGSRFVRKVVELLTNEEWRRRMGAAAVEKAHELYDWNAIAAEWEGMLQHLCAGCEFRTPALDPALNLLDSSLLRVHDEVAGDAPPELALKWLRKAWTSCGYSRETVPGLPRVSVESRSSGEAAALSSRALR
jgi:glycosyltransferase involved in cell wall biosynthesis